MRVQLAKWGNSLAIRLPMDCIRAAGLKEGDELDAEVSATEIRLIPTQIFDKAAFLQRLRDLRDRMPMTQPVVETMRREDRY